MFERHSKIQPSPVEPMKRGGRIARVIMSMILLAVPAKSHAQSLDAKLEAAIRANETIEIARVLSQGASPNHTTDGGTPMLVLAANMADLGAAKLLLEHGARVDARSKRGRTALHAAAQFGRSDLAQVLLQRGADVNDSGSKVTPIHAAVYGQQADMIDLLVEHGAKVDTPLSSGWTALQLAVVLNKSDDRAAATISLLRSGANPNVVDRAGDTPLHVALGNLRPSLTIVKALLHFNASITIANKKGETPLELGKRSPLKELATLFSEADVYAKVKADSSVSVSYPMGEAIQAGKRKTYTMYVPYEASEGGLYIRVKLGGNLAPAFRITSPGLVWSHSAMAWYWVRIPGGEKELRLELVAPTTISRATHIGLSTSIVTQDGEPTHASHLQMIIPATPAGTANPKSSN